MDKRERFLRELRDDAKARVSAFGLNTGGERRARDGFRWQQANDRTSARD